MSDVCVLPFCNRFTGRKSNDAFVRTSLRWNELGSREVRLIFMVITMEEDPELFDTFGLESYPSLVYLPESHAVSEAGNGV